MVLFLFRFIVYFLLNVGKEILYVCFNFCSIFYCFNFFSDNYRKRYVILVLISVLFYSFGFFSAKYQKGHVHFFYFRSVFIVLISFLLNIRKEMSLPGFHILPFFLLLDNSLFKTSNVSYHKERYSGVSVLHKSDN